ncbi:hypothetical protein Amet_2589 [Alkaliphilus metalliredigens QYMF]|uniref:Uncharacterized protein n=1 Tax=Alkaliphilus metalliredigens (strain QYMF) TaxID=293826 RepID=A6TRC3_ALKMQ|nr:hypothetical protein [Alkaliphilus metalliredigens]ABR48741.1 hypothetical protein Amet_2589 [Alkaliphilus metalliredigens QYMF]
MMRRNSLLREKIYDCETFAKAYSKAKKKKRCHMRYMIYVKDENQTNNMTIECHDAEEMAEYASKCIKQGYREVKAVTERDSE